jgi:lipid-A-disaccharide synthase
MWTSERPFIVDTRAHHRDLQAAGTAALAASGTVTLELALAGLPHVVTYKTSPLLAPFISALLKTPWVSLPNIIANAPIVPELLQAKATPDLLSEALRPLLLKQEAWHNQKKAFTQLTKGLCASLPFGQAGARVVASYL